MGVVLSYAETVGNAWKKATEVEKARPPMVERTYTYASGWRECRRAMCLDLLHPEDTVFEGQTLERFRDGDRYEEAAVAHLMRAGQLSEPRFKVERTQERFWIEDRKGRPVIVGKIEGVLKFGYREDVIFELKSGTSVQNVNSLQGLRHGRWTKSILPQVYVYLFGKAIEKGVLVLNRPGWPKLLDVELDDEGYRVAENFIQRATTAVAVKRGEEDLPDFHGDPGVCLMCDHRGKSCAPPIDSGEGLQLVIDEALEESARLVVENETAAKDYKRARDHVAKSLRGKPLVSIGGKYTATGKWQQRTTYKVPDVIERQYQAVKKQWPVINPKGAWTMDIVKAPEAKP